MATPALVLPANNQPLVDANGLLTVPGRAALQNAINSLQAQINALTADSPSITTPSLIGLQDAANDAAAAAAGVPVDGVYRNGSVLMIRVT